METRMSYIKVYIQNMESAVFHHSTTICVSSTYAWNHPELFNCASGWLPTLTDTQVRQVQNRLHSDTVDAQYFYWTTGALVVHNVSLHGAIATRECVSTNDHFNIVPLTQPVYIDVEMSSLPYKFT